MKKKYISPALYVSNLSMASGVASGCLIPANYAEYGCPVTIPEWGMTIFTETDCEFSAPGIDDLICYHVPFADNSIFSS